MHAAGPVVAMVWEGKQVVKYGRTMIGTTNPLASAPGTIRHATAVTCRRSVALRRHALSHSPGRCRCSHLCGYWPPCLWPPMCALCRGDFGIDVGRNIIHGSDSVEVRTVSPACADTHATVVQHAHSHAHSHAPRRLQSAQREIALWFKAEELAEYTTATAGWVYE